MTRLTSDERAAILAEINAAEAEAASCMADARRLRGMLDAQPDGSDGDTIRLLQPLCRCGLPLDHRHPVTGEPRPCSDETARIALTEGRTRPPVPSSVTRDESRPQGYAANGRVYCCATGVVVYDKPCPVHGAQVPADLEDGNQ